MHIIQNSTLSLIEVLEQYIYISISTKMTKNHAITSDLSFVNGFGKVLHLIGINNKISFYLQINSVKYFILFRNHIVEVPNDYLNSITPVKNTPTDKSKFLSISKVQTPIMPQYLPEDNFVSLDNLYTLCTKENTNCESYLEKSMIYRFDNIFNLYQADINISAVMSKPNKMIQLVVYVTKISWLKGFQMDESEHIEVPNTFLEIPESTSCMMPIRDTITAKIFNIWPDPYSGEEFKVSDNDMSCSSQAHNIEPQNSGIEEELVENVRIKENQSDETYAVETNATEFIGVQTFQGD